MNQPTAAQIANDMKAHARFWERRDKRVEQLCLDAAALIHDLDVGTHVDGRRIYGVRSRLCRFENMHRGLVQGWPKFGRARLCIEKFKASHETAS